MDEIRILHCGDLGHMISDNLLDEIGDVDVLLVPVGGIFTIGAKLAASLAKKIEPFIVVPMHYKTEKHTKDFEELQTVDVFEKEIDKEAARTDKLVLSRDKLPKELEVVVLTV